jgi:hypothetical protein
MKQHEAVIQALEQLGGIATLGQLYQEAPKIPGSKWATKTPFASIRRIVQLRREIYKIKPGLYGLTSKKAANEAKGAVAETSKNKDSYDVAQFNHSYYQGLLLQVGALRSHGSWCPNQDKNRLFLDKPLGELRTLQMLPAFSYPELVQRSSSVDVIWFNKRGMPHTFFEVEHSTDIQNSLLKFNDLQDFFARMLIVSDMNRQKEYAQKIKYSSFNDIAGRVRFLAYDRLVKQYEYAVEASRQEMVL